MAEDNCKNAKTLSIDVERVTEHRPAVTIAAALIGLGAVGGPAIETADSTGRAAVEAGAAEHDTTAAGAVLMDRVAKLRHARAEGRLLLPESAVRLTQFSNWCKENCDK
jgi:hypothetical protein